MDWITVQDEFQVFSTIHGCASHEPSWRAALDLLGTTLRCRPYLLEFQGSGHHTGRFCPPREAAALTDTLSAISTEGGKTAFTFLLKDAPLHYPYWKPAVPMEMGSGGPNGPDDGSSLAMAPGILTPVMRTGQATVLLACLFDPETGPPPDRGRLVPTFQRLSKTIAQTLEISCALIETAEAARVLSVLAGGDERAALVVHPDLSVAAMTPAFGSAIADGSLILSDGLKIKSAQKAIERAMLDVSTDLSNILHALRKAETGSDLKTEQRFVYARCKRDILHSITVDGIIEPPRHGAHDHGAYLLIQIQHPKRDLETAGRLLHEVYGLSAREADLACRLTTARTLQDVIEALGISRNTAKTHLRRIFEKTNTKSQLELANLVHALAQLG
ncbi:helix-turn-helix transcriptional regulator [Roseibium aquae]|nr:helix-turn-helix transcriptional regulator [Roseibium aquae]